MTNRRYARRNRVYLGAAFRSVAPIRLAGHHRRSQHSFGLVIGAFQVGARRRRAPTSRTAARSVNTSPGESGYSAFSRGAAAPRPCSLLVFWPDRF